MTLNKKVLLIITGVISVIILVFVSVIVYFIISFTINDKLSRERDKLSISTAAKDISTPSSYKLLSAQYTDYRCLDVCANLTLIYKRDGSVGPADDPFINQLLSKGYKLEDNSYTKLVKNQNIDINIDVDENDSSKVNVVISKDLDYLIND
jgi:hypothetical protein